MEKRINKHDFKQPVMGKKRLSVGVFQWIPGAKGLKKSKILVRVRGTDVALMMSVACSIATALDEGNWDGRKYVTV